MLALMGKACEPGVSPKVKIVCYFSIPREGVSEASERENKKLLEIPPKERNITMENKLYVLYLCH